MYTILYLLKDSASTTVAITVKNLTLEQATNALFKAMPASQVRFGIDAKSSVTLSGPADDVAKAKKVVEDLDAAAAGKPRK